MTDMSDTISQTVHGTAVSFQGKALLITGPSGAGKSALALDLIGRGAALVGDDLVVVEVRPEGLFAKPVPHAQGLIEARHVGLLQVPTEPLAKIIAEIDLSRQETERLPPLRRTERLGHSLRLFHGCVHKYFVTALWIYLNHTVDIDPDAALPAATKRE